jgi:DnaJ-domain-containing protein 1
MSVSRRTPEDRKRRKPGREGDPSAARNEMKTLDAAALRRTAAVVRDRRHVADRGDGEAHRLPERAARLTARTRTLNFDFERADAMFLRLAASIFCAICAA